MKSYLVLAILTFSLLSCGRSKTAPSFTLDRIGTPIVLAFENKDCQESSEIINLGEQRYYFTGDAQTLSFKDKDFSNFETSSSVQSEFLNGSFVFNSTQSLKICNSDHQYQEDSIEGAALASFSSLETTVSFYKNIHSSKEIENISFFQNLEFEEKTDLGIEVLTDNAFYSNLNPDQAQAFKLKSGPVLAFLPQSQDALEKGLYSGFPLWQIPFVASHEYAHHIFYTHFPKSKKGSEAVRVTRRNKEVQKDIKRKYQFMNLSKNNVVEDQNLPSVATAGLNEGVADLIAYYAMEGDNQNSLDGLSCLSHRSLNNENLGLTKKIIDQDFLEAYFNPSEEDEESDCNYPSLQNIHSMGAIFAYGSRQILDTLLISTDAKVGIVLKWLDELNFSYDTDKEMTGKDYLENSIKTFINEIEQDQGNLQQDTCAQVNQVFPAYQFDQCNLSSVGL